MSKDLSESRKPKGRKSVAQYIHYSCNTFCRCTPICQYVQEGTKRVLRQDCSFCANISSLQNVFKPICLRLFDHPMKWRNAMILLQKILSESGKIINR